MNFVDVEFINFVGRRFSYDSLFIVNEVPGKFGNFVVSYWPLFILDILLLVLFVWSTRKVTLSSPAKPLIWAAEKGRRVKLWLSHVFLCFVAIVVAVIGIRGGLQSKPINFVNANVFTAPLLNNLVLNSTFTFIKSYGTEKLKQEKYFADKNEMLEHLNGAHVGSLLEDIVLQRHKIS